MTYRAAVFASGRGSNFRALDEYVRSRTPMEATDPANSAKTKPVGTTPLWSVSLLVTDREDAQVLESARERGIPSAVVIPGKDSTDFAERLLEHLERERIDFILLAGYLRLIPAEVVRRFPGKILNLHPALLPAFGGKGMYGPRVHQAVLDAGASESGATIHFVDEEYDRGRILAQGSVPVVAGDTADTLAQRIHLVEHRIYPETVNTLVRALASGRDPLTLPTILRRFHPSIHTADFS